MADGPEALQKLIDRAVCFIGARLGENDAAPGSAAPSAEPWATPKAA
ncbi:hypothetical protein ACFW9N_23690 [Streptomyces sp. NPDC059496]